MARRFVDARGTEWQVWEVLSRPTLADRAPRPWLPEGATAEAQWLEFESDTQTRRLFAYPGWWHALPEEELETLCGLAHLESPPAVQRIVVGLADMR